MSALPKVKVVLCWHMHQPHYRDGLNGQYRLPWVYLHAIKDYTDMAALLEQNPAARVVVNFAPVLLEQLDDYSQQLKLWREEKHLMQDNLLNLLAGAKSIPSSVQGRMELVRACRRAYAPTMIKPFPAFSRLLDLLDGFNEHSPIYREKMAYLNDGYFRDLLVWYHLAWMGASLRDNDSRVKALLAKERGYDHADQDCLVDIIYDAIADIIPRYKALWQRGQIELSMTPYGHPIVPLLIDFKSLEEAMPDAPKPQASHYPDGYARAQWHLEYGLKVFESHFGHQPKGVWLSEGAVSEAAVGLLDEMDFAWTASGEGVWRHSCERSQINPHDLACKKALYQPMQQGSKNCKVFFRDDGLSDFIGFQYKDWQADHAAKDFAQHMGNIANFLGERAEESVVSIILDGENAWEYYPNNAQAFLTALYKELAEHPQVEMTTFGDAIENGAKARHLTRLKAGSWVYGSFSTWMGDPDKNRGWDLLVAAKRAYDQQIANNVLTTEQVYLATQQLAVCEGSDWFWWFGDYNPADSVSDFDQLYRRHLTRLYQLLHLVPPEELEIPLSKGGGNAENSGTMRRNI
ncbi:glycoside hydrolase [Thiomicrospira aerophila AL3]|uniref:Glycoside hydrolase n=1 Tax=Thiomicrospira aerophila AL3 TaxID=717772 RepID=W0DT42_9GAMM|nr:glycoside hydrolase family 57 protein [Thiomicrospira aerophila]AHF01765.1 glycoside hydrolase [Thiomicrospira aerophila AL3]